MKGLILTDPKTGSNMMIDAPEILPQFSLGTTVIAQVVDDNDQIVTIEGDVIGIEIQQDMDVKDYTVSTLIGYRVLEENSTRVHFVQEDQVHEYYPSSNEFDIAYHIRDDEE